MAASVEVSVFLRKDAPPLSYGALAMLLRDHLAADDVRVGRSRESLCVALYDAHLDIGMIILGSESEVEVFLLCPDFSMATFRYYDATPPEVLAQARADGFIR